MGGKSEERKIADISRKTSKEQLAQQLNQLQGIQLGQEEALKRAQDIYGQQTGTVADLQRQQIAQLQETPGAITELQQLIRDRALPEQQQALRQTKLAQAQAGVRGPEAALQQAMQASRMGTQLAQSTQEVALRQALEDRAMQQEALQRQQEFAKQQALAGLAQTLAPVQKVAEKEKKEKQKTVMGMPIPIKKQLGIL